MRYWKSEVFDYVILQQDAFDKTDSSTPIQRQKYMMNLIMRVVKEDYTFESFEEVNEYFRRMINILKQMNYSEYESEEFVNFEKDLEKILDERRVAVEV
jgi:V/A-type H+-transporting ATPase subunit A